MAKTQIIALTHVHVLTRPRETQRRFLTAKSSRLLLKSIQNYASTVNVNLGVWREYPRFLEDNGFFVKKRRRKRKFNRSFEYFAVNPVILVADQVETNACESLTATSFPVSHLQEHVDGWKASICVRRRLFKASFLAFAFVRPPRTFFHFAAATSNRREFYGEKK